MPLPVPNLDDRTFEQLVNEGRSLIPRYSEAWTNHNPSDPGITLIELLAYFTETGIFQLNQIPDSSIEAFLKLLNVARQQTAGQVEPLDRTIARSLLQLDAITRTVTDQDFEALARQVAQGTPVVSLKTGARATLADEHISKGDQVTNLAVTPMVFEVPRENKGPKERIRVGETPEAVDVTIQSVTDNILDVEPFIAPTDYIPAQPLARTAFALYQDKACGTADRPDQVPLAALVIVVPQDDPRDPQQPQPTEELTNAIFRKLMLHRPLGTRLHVIGPEYEAIDVTTRVVRKPGSGLAPREIEQAIRTFLHPLRGGPDAKGWSFGRAVYKSELYQRLESLPNVDHVESLSLNQPDDFSPQGLVFANQVNVTVVS